MVLAGFRPWQTEGAQRGHAGASTRASYCRAQVQARGVEHDSPGRDSRIVVQLRSRTNHTAPPRRTSRTTELLPHRQTARSRSLKWRKCGRIQIQKPPDPPVRPTAIRADFIRPNPKRLADPEVAAAMSGIFLLQQFIQSRRGSPKLCV